MLDTIGEIVGALVEMVASAVFAVARGLFRWEASAPRPAWVRVVAIGIILAACGVLLSMLLSILAFAFYVVVAIAVVVIAIAFFTAS